MLNIFIGQPVTQTFREKTSASQNRCRNSASRRSATQLNPPLSPLVKAPLKDPPMRISPSSRSSRARSRTGMGCRYTWKQLLSPRVTGRVRTRSSEKRNTCSLCEVRVQLILAQDKLVCVIACGWC